MLGLFLEQAADLDTAIVVTITKEGRLKWGTSCDNVPEVLWILKAMERILMDRSLGIIE